MGKITIKLNGENQPIKSSSITALLSSLQLNQNHVIVELNNTIIANNQYETTILNDNDVVEIIRYIGGGENKLSF